MKKLFPLVLLCGIIACNEDPDPGPDLTSGTISFKWNTPADITNYYVVISDTVGNVLRWSKLEDNTLTELPYPQDANLAVVTIIADTKFNPTAHVTRIFTYTGLAGDSYTYETLITSPPATDGDYKLTIQSPSQYSSVNKYISGDAVIKGSSSGTDSEQTTYGLYSNRTHNLYVSMTKSGTSGARYSYTPGVQPGQEKTIAPADFDTFTPLPLHAVNYPEHQQMTNTFAFLTGVSGNSTYLIYLDQWAAGQSPVLGFPDIPGLFPTYQTVMVSTDANNVSYTTEIKASQPTTIFGVLNGGIVSGNSLTTKRVSADLSGEGDVIQVTGGFGPVSASAEWQLFSKAAGKVRINPPQFPSDLIAELPNLATVKDKSFAYFAIRKINMSYEDFCNLRLKGKFYTDPDILISKVYDAQTF